MAIQDIARSIVNRTGEFGGNVQELAKNILDKRQQRQEFFNQNPEAQKAVNRLKPPMQRAVEFVGKNYLYNPEDKKLFPASPMYTIQDMMNIQQQRQSGELSEKEARKQLSQKAVNMAMVMGELSPSPKAVNNQAARALKMLEEQAKQYDSVDDFINSQKVVGYDASYRTDILRGNAEYKRLDASPDKSYIFEANNIPENSKTVTIYRSAPGDFRPGDFAGLNEETAKNHLRTSRDKIWTKEVPVSDLIQGADQYEVIYAPKSAIKTEQQLKDIYNQATQPQLSDDLIKEAQKYKSAEEFWQKMGMKNSDALRARGIKGRDAIFDFWNKNVTPAEKIIDDLNPTGGLLVDYDPQSRMTMPLGENITTLDKTMKVSPEKTITIYRGAPKNQKAINPGDFVTTNYELAKSYTGDNNVLSLKVKAKDVLDDITEPLGEEYIYRPLTDIWNKAMSKVKGK